MKRNTVPVDLLVGLTLYRALWCNSWPLCSSFPSPRFPPTGGQDSGVDLDGRAAGCPSALTPPPPPLSPHDSCQPSFSGYHPTCTHLLVATACVPPPPPPPISSSSSHLSIFFSLSLFFSLHSLSASSGGKAWLLRTEPMAGFVTTAEAVARYDPLLCL